MRAAFATALTDLAEETPSILLITGDLGFMVWESFASRFPSRFFNAGVAEQNMVGVATGLAECGFIPFTYSIATFATLRPYEFIRNGPIFHKLRVRIVGMGGGFDYGSGGSSHHALEDVGILRIQPGIHIITPADSLQARTALRSTWNIDGPVYYRLSKNDEAVVPDLNGRFDLRRLQIVREGSDLLLIAMGSAAVETWRAAENLARQGVAATVAIAACMGPEPIEGLSELIARFPLVVSVENHSIVGGLGSLIAELMATGGSSGRLLRCGVREAPDGITGSEAFYLQRHGLRAESIAGAALRELRKTS